MDKEVYVDADGVACPCKPKHLYNEKIRLVGNSVYRCACGCEFEWYGEHSWYIISHSRYGVPEQYDLSGDSEEEPVHNVVLIEEKQETPPLINGFFMAFALFAWSFIMFLFGLICGVMSSTK